MYYKFSIMSLENTVMICIDVNIKTMKSMNLGHFWVFFGLILPLSTIYTVLNHFSKTFIIKEHNFWPTFRFFMYQHLIWSQKMVELDQCLNRKRKHSFHNLYKFLSTLLSRDFVDVKVLETDNESSWSPSFLLTNQMWSLT